MDIFEQASRQNLTFTTERGTVGFSDLWKFTEGQLNTLYVDLKKVADSTTSGLISTNTSLSNKTKLQMAIVESRANRSRDCKAASATVINREGLNKIAPLCFSFLG